MIRSGLSRGARSLSAALLAVLLAMAGCSSGASGSRGSSTSPSAAGTSVPAGTLENPVLGQGADPYVLVRGGRYYYVQSATTGHGVTLRTSTSLATLDEAPEQPIVQAEEKAPCCEYWAPEVHQLGKRWYVYVAADNGSNAAHRMYVFGAPAITGPYRFAGELQLPGDRWAIDATVFTLGGDRAYVVWSGWPGRVNGEQDIYLARLATPTRTSGPAVRLSRPTYEWERQAGNVGVVVNEAPAVLRHGGKLFLTYSASGCWTPEYALGMLTARESADLTDPGSWTKSAKPVFAGGADSGLYGTGHNGFFSSPDGSQTWLVYHAVTDPGGSCEGDRQVYAQPITFGTDGTPQFGKPSDDPVPLPAGDPGR